MGPLFQTDSLIRHIYIHVPFCIKKCHYCSFYSLPYTKENVEQYLSALKKEIRYYHSMFRIKPETLYLGGGTPSLLSPDQIYDLSKEFDLSDIKEFTIEVNPGTIKADYAQEYLALGINRISIGVQSFNEQILDYLGRIHTQSDALHTIEMFKKNGFKNISIDLIYGIKDQKVEDFLDTIRQFLSLKLHHLSFYGLTLEEDVFLYKDISLLPPEETIVESYTQAVDLLKQNGFQQYEISNFSLPGYESKHNLSYWTGKSYLGCGPSAAGYVRDFRYVNDSDLDIYVKKTIQELYFSEKIDLSDIDLKNEYLITRLRLTEGFNLKEYRDLFHKDFIEEYQNKKFLFNDRYLLLEKDWVRMNPAHFLVSNEILEYLI